MAAPAEVVPLETYVAAEFRLHGIVARKEEKPRPHEDIAMVDCIPGTDWVRPACLPARDQV